MKSRSPSLRKLITYLEVNNIKQQKLSNDTGISKGTISKTVRGLSTPSTVNAKLISDFTNGHVEASGWV